MKLPKMTMNSVSGGTPNTPGSACCAPESMAIIGCAHGYHGPYFSELTSRMFGSVKMALTAIGAAKLDQATETASCSAASGMQATPPRRGC